MGGKDQRGDGGGGPYLRNEPGNQRGSEGSFITSRWGGKITNRGEERGRLAGISHHDWC